MAKTIQLGPDKHLTVDKIAATAYGADAKVIFTPLAKAKVLSARSIIEKAVKRRQVIYGVTTGFGSFKNKFIGANDVAELQRNLIRSHSVGVGSPLPQFMVKAAMIARLNSLLQGYSGVRLELLELLAAMINRNVIPVTPSQGSVGSSGDLAPLSHIGLVLMGEGRAWFNGAEMTGAEALKRAGLKPIAFMEKEGLAWNNGTSVMLGIASINFYEAMRLANLADMSCAMTLEALCGVSGAFDKRMHNVRPHPGQQIVAARIRKFVAGSKLVDSMPNRVQDAYSIRCAPQVHGAVRDALAYVGSVIDRELNSATDNPLIFSKPDKVISGGNFHGEPIAIAMDTFGIALSELANISERRTAKLVDSSTNEGLPMFLIAKEKGGLHNGLMMTQYTAAALVSENKVLAHPASVDSIPTSANQEDHVSMGTIAARKASEILKNTENVLAIEFLTAAQAIYLRGANKLGAQTKLAYKVLRKNIPPITEDRIFHHDIHLINELMRKDMFMEIAA